MARLLEVKVGLGVTMEREGKWYKPDISFKIAIEGEEQTNEELRKPVLERAFELAENAIGEELERLLGE